MKIHSYIEKSLVNGPGTRFTIWVQGCSIHCDGCVNRNLWDFSGPDTSPEKLLTLIDSTKGIDGVSITGGEPLDQYEALLEFLRLVYPKYEVFLTSGYTLNQIGEKFPEVLKYVDILIDGPFEKDKMDSSGAWRGSTNQGINLLSERVQKYKDYKSEFSAELIFQKNGQMIATGFAVPNFITKRGY